MFLPTPSWILSEMLVKYRPRRLRKIPFKSHEHVEILKHTEMNEKENPERFVHMKPIKEMEEYL